MKNILSKKTLMFVKMLIIILTVFVSKVVSEPQRTVEKISSNDKYKKEFLKNERILVDELGATYWQLDAQLTLRDRLATLPNLRRAKNAILFLGDGMSVPTIAAARAYSGQLAGKRGEESKLFFENFPYTGFSKTYCVDKQVADSACSATAYLCGVKANYGTIGVNANVKYNDCPAGVIRSNHVSSLAKWSQDSGKGTGIVTTTRITHASPAGTYAHTASREYECDADISKNGQNPKECQDIATQLILNEPGNKFKVIMGGGRKKFLPNSKNDTDGETGERLDSVNLIEEWLKSHKGVSRYVRNLEELNSVSVAKTDYLLGLFESDHLQYHLDADEKIQPTLADMTEKAIKMLKKEKNGFFLFVEGGRIDHGHHETQARKALDETVQFSNAIQLAYELTAADNDTLIVVTSDHSHSMTYTGYSNRGADILGLNTLNSDIDKYPYTTISYANGPGYKKEVDGHRYNLSNDNLSDKNYKYPSMVPLKDENHGGDDVGVFSIGPWAHLLTGFFEQNFIPHSMAFSMCVGDGLTLCSK